MPRDVVPMESAPAGLRQLLHHPVHRKQHVRPVADEQAAPHLDAGGFQGVDFPQQGGRIDDQPVADHRLLSRVQNPAGNQLQNELLIADHHRVARVVAALIARHDVEPGGEADRRSSLCPRLPTEIPRL